jgi:hypothetical protein
MWSLNYRARSVSECRDGLGVLINTAASKAVGTDCLVHWQVLAVRNLPSDFERFMSPAIVTVHFIKYRDVH